MPPIHPLGISTQSKTGLSNLTAIQKGFLVAMAVPLLPYPSFIGPFGQFLGIVVYASAISASGWGIGVLALGLPKRRPRPTHGAHYQRRVAVYNQYTASMALLAASTGIFCLTGVLARVVLGDWKLLIVGGVPTLVVSFGFAAYARHRNR